MFKNVYWSAAQNDYGSTAPLNNNYGSTAPLNNKYGSTAPLNNNYESTAFMRALSLSLSLN